jgi:hypothetical protein
MASIVVGGSGRGVGKTALVCGLIAALPEYRWIAVKITSHAHGKAEPVWEEHEPGADSDTARYLGAGAIRALLLIANDLELPARWRDLQAGLEPGANLIVESNRILGRLRPDLCLAVLDEEESVSGKPSFQLAARHADAWVECSLLIRPSNSVLPSHPFRTKRGEDGAPTNQYLRAESTGAEAPLTSLRGKPIFRLASPGQLPPELLAWTRLALRLAPSS